MLKPSQNLGWLFCCLNLSIMIAAEDIYKIYKKFPNIQTDTRKLQSGDLFFGLKGENFNGNLFANRAIELGAAYAIVDEPVKTEIPEKIIQVDNVLKTMQDLAEIHRLQFNIPFIAITGSNGKTTTKELIHAVLSSSFKTYTTQGNLNNHIGIPLTILGIKGDAEMAVIEMGANHLKEITSYCQYTIPSHGIITNCGKAHLEGFGSIEGVRKGKGELYDYLRSSKGAAFVMWDYDYLRKMSKGISEIIKYGTADADITGKIHQNSTFLTIDITSGGPIRHISTKLAGDYNLPNVLAAIAVGNYFKVPGANIKAAIENYTPSNARSQLIEINSNKIILDAYNANPSSMKVAIENFANIPAKKKILILGGMAELGSESLQEHKNIIKLIGQNSWQEVALVGGDFLKIKHPYHHFENSLEAKNWFREKKFQESFILIKGSRSMQMERVLEN
jgi:UDP-N-acetylmuramoyl-tripeptide--D-alanyl-D-alanine ligase